MIQLGNASVTQVRTSGTITAAAPTIGAHLTTKTYVDDKFTTLSNQNLKTTDVVTFGGLKLPTIGGTAATLSHYEEYDWVFQWKYGANLSTSVTVKIVKIGKVATYSMTNLPVWNALVQRSSLNLPYCPQRDSDPSQPHIRAHPFVWRLEGLVRLA